MVKQHCQDTENHYGHKEPCHLEGLAGVYDQISKSLSCTDKFADDHSYKAQTYVHLHYAKKKGNGRRQYDLQKFLLLSSSQCFN